MPPTKKTRQPLKSIENCVCIAKPRNRPNLRSCEKKIIRNIHIYFQQLNSGEIQINPCQIVANTARCCGVSESSVKKVIKECEESEYNVPPSPKKSTGRKRVILDEFFQGVVRRKVHSFYIKKIYPTVEQILCDIKNDFPDFQDISESTMLRILNSMGFSFKKLNSKPVCFESTRIIEQRQRFLRTTKRLRDRGCRIYYTDETFCGANHKLQFGWQENVSALDPRRLDFDRGVVQEVNGWKGGIITPSGAGKRVIILHIGDKNGFLQPDTETMLVFEGKKGAADYHSEMNALHYEEWFRRVLNIIPDNSGLVIDQAPYHTMQAPETKNPNMGWLKDDIIDWLVDNQIEPPIDDAGKQDPYSKYTRPLLIEMGRPKFKKFKYLLDRIIEESGKNITLIWTPVSHCELNAIELIWAWVKSEVAKANSTFKIKDVEQLCKNKLREVTPDLWAKCVEHTIRIEEEYTEKDMIVDELVNI